MISCMKEKKIRSARWRLYIWRIKLHFTFMPYSTPVGRKGKKKFRRNSWHFTFMPCNTPMTTITSPPPPFLQKLFWIENINRWNDKQRGGCKRFDLFANWIKQYFVSDLQSYSFVSLYCQYYGHYRHYGLSTWLHSVTVSKEDETVP